MVIEARLPRKLSCMPEMKESMRAKCVVVSGGSGRTIASVRPTRIAHNFMRACAAAPVGAPPRPGTLAFAHALPVHLRC